MLLLRSLSRQSEGLVRHQLVDHAVSSGNQRDRQDYSQRDELWRDFPQATQALGDCVAWELLSVLALSLKTVHLAWCSLFAD